MIKNLEVSREDPPIGARARTPLFVRFQPLVVFIVNCNAYDGLHVSVCPSEQISQVGRVAIKGDGRLRDACGG